MSKKLQSVRGTHDALPHENTARRFVIDTARTTGELYGFAELSTPIFEFTDVFARTLGETSDVVSKEMYSFMDRGGESLTLRPEFTAGIMRAFISGGMQQNLPLKFFSSGALFRYERPQKGRFRQFHQINFECLGVDSPVADIETIALADQILSELGIRNKITLEINSLGCPESRTHYRDRLVEYFTAHKDALSEDSKLRLEKNPLRILDSKDAGDKKIAANAPKMECSYTDESRVFFAEVLAGLDAVGIEYTVNEKLVRGLDYYCHTVFEFTSDALGSQNAVLAGGRYDGLAELMGGKPTPAIGFAGGIERLCELVDYTAEIVRPVSIIPLGDAAKKKAVEITMFLRGKGITVDLGYAGNLGKRLKKANAGNASHAVIIGEEEMQKGVAIVRNLDSGEQTEVACDVDEIGKALTA